MDINPVRCTKRETCTLQYCTIPRTREGQDCVPRQGTNTARSQLIVKCRCKCPDGQHRGSTDGILNLFSDISADGYPINQFTRSCVFPPLLMQPSTHLFSDHQDRLLSHMSIANCGDLVKDLQCEARSAWTYSSALSSITTAYCCTRTARHTRYEAPTEQIILSTSSYPYTTSCLCAWSCCQL